MKASAVYLRAAEFLDNGDANFYGYALDLAGQPNGGYDASPMQARFNQMFHPVMDKYLGNELVALALCLMSAIAAWDESHG